MSDQIGMAIFGLLMTAYFSYVLYSGFNEGSIAFRGVSFSRAEKPFFFWALMFLAGFMAFSGIAGAVGTLVG